MRGLIAACLLAAALVSFAPSAHAVDMNAGDSCAGFVAGDYRPTGGRNNPDGAFVVCDGSIWQPILRYSSVGNAVMFASTGMPAAPLHVWGEAIIGSNGLACAPDTAGGLRFNSASAIVELCDGSAWTGVGGGASAPGSDREIVFNSGGNFSADSGLVFTSTGNVGIGTTSPGNTLHIVREGFSPASNDLAALRVEGNWGGGIVFSETDKRSAIWSPGGQQLRFGTGGTSAGFGSTAGDMAIDENGDVGIGTADPQTRLDVAGLMRAIDDAAGCTATERGAIRFNSAGAALEVCDGGTWGGVGGVSAINDLSDGISDGSSVFLGAGAGASDDGTSNNNTALGISALNAVTTGTANTSIGAEALMSFASSGSTAVGYRAAKNVTGGNDNVAVGSLALEGAVGSTGSSNTAIGRMALHSNDTGWSNVAVGIYSLQNNTTGKNNVIVGSWAGRNNTTGSYNVAFGESTFYNNTTGYGNTAIGNFAMGSQAGVPNGDMDANTAIGYHAGLKIEGGAEGAGGNSNTLLGYEAGSTITIGDSNIMIGRNAQPTSATASNELNIGNTIYGDLSTDKIGIGIVSPAVPLDISGIMRAIDDAAGCTATERGAIRFNSAGGALELCDGSAWGSVASGGAGLWSDSGSGYIYYNSALGGMRIGDVSGQPAPNIIGVTNLGDLGDAAISSPSDGQLLTYNNSTGEWENQDAPAGDNLGNHTATENIKMSGFWLSNDGGDEGVFVDAAGKVGIGTAAPAKTLDVAGDVQITSSSASPLRIVADDPDIVLGFIEGATAGLAELKFASSSGATMADIAYDRNNENLIIYGDFDNNGTGNIVFRGQGGGSPLYMTMDRPSGNVGIGTASPSSTLHVRGTTPEITVGATSESGEIQIYSDDVNSKSTRLRYEPGTANFYIDSDVGNQNLYIGDPDGSSEWSRFVVDVNSANGGGEEAHVFQVNGSTVLEIENNGNVGIGTASPGADLQIGEVGDGDDYENIVLKTSSGGDGVYKTEIYTNHSSPDTGGIKSGGAKLQFSYGGKTHLSDYQGLDFYTASTLRMTIEQSGNICGADAVFEACSSDARLKKDIEPFGYRLDVIRRLQPVTFSWNKKGVDLYDYDPDQRRVGFLAQDVLNAIPEWVSTDEKGYYTVDDGELRYMLLSAVQQLADRDDAQQAQIDELLQSNEELLREVNGLKAHTGYGVSRAEVGIWVLAVTFGLSSLLFLIGGVLRHRAAKAA